jgi:pilus assembly protein CpaB
MNPRRLMIALLIALVLSGGMTFFLSRRVATHRTARPQTRRYVTASRSIQSGEVLKLENLAMVDWPESVPVQGGFGKVDDLAGRSVIYPVASGQPILNTYLAAPGSGIGLTVRIPEGMRATSVRSDDVVGVAGFLFPGSHVDVLVTYHSDRAATPATQIVLQDVEVLTAGKNFEPDPQGKAQSVNVVTLLLSPQDAQKVVLAASQGSIQFVLRNGADRGRVNPIPVEIAALFGQGTSHAVGGRTTPKLSNNEGYVVETIIGDKHSSARFE